MLAIVGGLVAFAVVFGWAAVRWRATGRDPSYLDDPSILLPAPPDGMTAATATIVDGGPAPMAFMAALFDLASRDEIAFRDETPDGKGAHHVGIELRGGQTDDARILLNRRRPVGEGEAWLLANLKSYAVLPARASGGDEGRTAAVAAMAAFSGFLSSPLTAGPGALARGSFTEGMTAVEGQNLQTALIGALERNGKPVPDALRGDAGRDTVLSLLREALANPDTVRADPAAFARHIEAETGYAPTAEEMEQLTRMLHEREALLGPSTDGAAGSAGTYIPATRALTFHPPLGFATFVETYARRKGWIKGLSFVSRWKWEGLAIAEVVVGLVVAAADGIGQQLVYGVGLGIAAGGVATWFVARYMASRTQEGAIMKAQLAAYRRTLKATFETSPTLDDVVRASRMTWLETPDHALVWGVALGLRQEIEAVLRRTTSGMDAGTVARSAFLPRWVGRARGAVSAAASEMSAAYQPAAGNPAPSPAATAPTAPDPGAIQDYAAVFAGIERIGTVTPRTTDHR